MTKVKTQAQKNRQNRVARLKRKGVIESARGLSNRELYNLERAYNKKARKVDRTRPQSTKRGKAKQKSVEVSEREKALRKIRRLKKKYPNLRYNVKGKSLEELNEFIKMQEKPLVTAITKYEQMINIASRLADNLEEDFGLWDNPDFNTIIYWLRNVLPGQLDSKKVNGSNWVPHEIFVRYLPPSDFEVDTGENHEVTDIGYIYDILFAYFSKYMRS